VDSERPVFAVGNGTENRTFAQKNDRVTTQAIRSPTKSKHYDTTA
jgi:hypothetical protein